MKTTATQQVWEVCDVPPLSESARADDDCRPAYRVRHIALNKSIPVPFARLRDAELAAAIIRSKCPCVGIDDEEEVKAEIFRVFTNWTELRKVLCEQCCAW